MAELLFPTHIDSRSLGTQLDGDLHARTTCQRGFYIHGAARAGNIIVLLVAKLGDLSNPKGIIAWAECL